MTCNSLTAPQLPVVDSSSTRNGAVDFQYQLDSGEVLTGSPTVTEDAPGTSPGLTITNAAVNTVALSINGATVPIGHAVQFKITGIVAGTMYRLKVSANTDSTPAQTLIGYVRFLGC